MSTGEHPSPRITLPRGAGQPEAPVAAGRVVVGSTSHFELSYDPTLATGAQLADGLTGSCESDYGRLRQWFGVEPTYSWWQDVFGDDKIQVTVRPTLLTASWEQNDGSSIDIFVATTDQQDLQLARAGFVAELDEIFMDATASWDPGNSDGEGLSRVLSFDLYPPLDAAAQLFETVPTWLLTVNHFGNRRDWVTRPEPTDLDYDSIGCASLFLNWLRYDLHFGWHEIINASGIEQYGPVLFPISATLALRYDMLTGDTGGFYRFTFGPTLWSLGARWALEPTASR